MGLLDAVSTNETWFFRNPKHFSFVKETLCPGWIAEAEAGRRPRRVAVWSAASSSGEEPFSLAMVLLDALPGWTSTSWPPDLSSRVLERAQPATWSIEKSGESPRPTSNGTRFVGSAPRTEDEGRAEILNW